MNVNQLFPRLSIRSKLAIAFTLLTLIPLVVTAVLGVRHTVTQVRALARTTLENDLARANTEAGHHLQELERDVGYLASFVRDPLLETDQRPDRWKPVGQSISNLLGFKPALYSIKVIDTDGALILVADASGSEFIPPSESSGEGLYYALRAESIGPGKSLLLPVELRQRASLRDSSGTVPAIAVLAPVHDPDGLFMGVVVGEARAAELFAPLETVLPQLGGVTGLVDSEGLYLYHTAWKRDWASLLASRTDVNLRSELSDGIAETMLSMETQGTMPAAEGQLVSFAPLQLAGPGSPSLLLYRVVALAALEGGVRGFLKWVSLGGAGVFLLVLGLATLAAHQLTQPIYQLRKGARRLAGGFTDEPLEIATNDELEDLAADFSAMAASLAEERHKRETLLQQRTEALRETHAELAGILQHSADAIVGLDLDHRVRVWNAGAEALFRYVESEALGKEIDSLIVPPGERWSREASFLRREVTERGAVTNFQTERVTRDAEQFPVSLTQTAIHGSDGQPIGYSLIIRDTRMQSRLERQMRRSERLAAVSVMAAGLAHELGNPLAILGNRIECMEGEIQERGAGRFLEGDLGVLREHVARLDSVVKDLLRFAHAGSNNLGPVELSGTTARILDLLERTYAARGIRLELDLESSLPPLWGNEKAIETVCVNLVMNALDVTPTGGTVSVHTRLSEHGDAVMLEVRDTGPGLPAELHRRIFEPFFTTKKAGQGTGLGLAVCRNIVERHGGGIWVESEPGRGSRFFVMFPLHTSDEPWQPLES